MRIFLSLILVLGISYKLFASDDQGNFSLSSPTFKNGGNIPKIHACSRLGDNQSPELHWTQAPTNAKSFIVLCHDLDAIEGFFIHWIIYNIPADANHLAEGIVKSEKLPNGAMQGINSFHHLGYDGPCPPAGSPHRYVFTVYALDSLIPLDEGANYPSLQEAMKGHIISKAELLGYFQS